MSWPVHPNFLVRHLAARFQPAQPRAQRQTPRWADPASLHRAQASVLRLITVVAGH